MSVIEFVPGIWPLTLTKRSRNLLKEILQAQELAKFIKRNNLVGYTPNPDGPDDLPRPWPFPWPGPPWWSLGLGSPDPQTNFHHVIQGELFIAALTRSKGAKESSSAIDVIKREGIAQEAFKELSVSLSDLQKSVQQQLKDLG